VPQKTKGYQMAKTKGRAFAIKISDGAAGYQFFGGLTGKSVTINNSMIDVTTGDEANPDAMAWREQLADLKTIDISGDLRVLGTAAEKRLVALSMADDPSDMFEVLHPSLGTFVGKFVLADLVLSEESATTASLSLQSDGPITYTAPA
jgi:predicted secreted protein